MKRMLVGLLLGALLFAPAAGTNGGGTPDECLNLALAISKRRDGTLYMTTRPSQSKVYVALVSRQCMSGSPDDYRWPGYKGKP